MEKALEFVKEHQDNEELILGLFHASFNFWDSDITEDIYELLLDDKFFTNEKEAWEMAIKLRDALRNGEIPFDYSVKVVF
jgi:hypothetical protein